jgi:hypothetical protein
MTINERIADVRTSIAGLKAERNEISAQRRSRKEIATYIVGADLDLTQAADFDCPIVKLSNPAPGLCLQCVELGQ